MGSEILTKARKFILFSTNQKNDWIKIFRYLKQTMFFIEGPTLSIEARSIRDPRIIYEKSITEDKDLFQENLDNANNEDGGSIIIEFFRVWQTVIISLVVIIFGSIGVVKAIQYRLEQDRKRLGLPSEEDTTTAGEWMSKFMKKTETKIFIEILMILILQRFTCSPSLEFCNMSAKISTA